MSKKEFPIKGHCLSTNPIIVKYLKDNFKGNINNVYSKKAIGVAWNEDRWWYVIQQSSTPEFNPIVIMNIITKINEMKNLPITGTLSTSSGTMLDNDIYATTTPIYNPNDSFSNIKWINGLDVSTTTVKKLVTEPTKLRIKCQNLKKSLKVSLLQINLK